MKKLKIKYLVSILLSLSFCNQCKSQSSFKRNNVSDIIVLPKLNENLDFTMILSNTSDTSIFYYNCFSLQEIDINKYLLFSFYAINKASKNKRLLTKNFINPIDSKCLKKIEKNNQDSIKLNLVHFFKDIKTVDFEKEQIGVRISLYYMILNQRKHYEDTFELQ